MIDAKKLKKALSTTQMYWIHSDIFHQDILFLYGEDVDFLEKEVRANTKPDPDYEPILQKIFNFIRTEDYRGVYFDYQPFRVIYLKEKESLSDFMSVMSHEALHCTFGLLKYRGLKPSEKSEEIYTHFLDFLIENIVKLMFEKDETN